MSEEQVYLINDPVKDSVVLNGKRLPEDQVKKIKKVISKSNKKKITESPTIPQPQYLTERGV